MVLQYNGVYAADLQGQYAAASVELWEMGGPGVV